MSSVCVYKANKASQVIKSFTFISLRSFDLPLKLTKLNEQTFSVKLFFASIAFIKHNILRGKKKVEKEFILIKAFSYLFLLYIIFFI
jgi:hypothetical protein